MKTLKVMSIIGIVWFLFCLLCVIGFSDEDPDAAIGWGLLAILYAVPFSITALVMALKARKTNEEFTRELLNLNDLKEKGIISEEEFQMRKAVSLRM